MSKIEVRAYRGAVPAAFSALTPKELLPLMQELLRLMRRLEQAWMAGRSAWR